MSPRRSKVRLALALAATVALSSMDGAFAADFTMKFGTATFREGQHEFINIYKSRVESASKGRIEVKDFPRSQLGPIPQQIEGVQFGTIEAFISPADFYVGIDPRYGVFSIPTLFRDRGNAAKTVADPDVNEAILKLADDKGLVGLGVIAYGVADYTAKTPLRALDDFKGKKFRVNATPAERERMRRLGATAVPMTLGEVLPSLQRGVIDGTMSAISIYVSVKFNDVVKVVTGTNDTMLVSVAVGSKAWLDKLPADLRKAVVDEGRATQGLAQAWNDTFMDSQAEEWRKMGGEIHTLAKPELDKLNALLKTVGDDVTKDDAPSRAFLDRVRSVAAKH